MSLVEGAGADSRRARRAPAGPDWGDGGSYWERVCREWQGELKGAAELALVRSHQIIASTYEPFPSYRLVTGNGVCTLPQGLDAHVLAHLDKVGAEERKKGE